MEQVFTLNNGLTIPALGFGTWQLTEGEEAYQAVRHALKVGYRHIDTAQIYGNEKSVGQAIKDSDINREALYVTTKVWNDRRDYDSTTASIEESLEKLQLEYIDLVLIHWPNPKALRDQAVDAWKSANADTWRSLEDLVEAGKIRSIGVSNFMVHHLEELLKTARIKPAVNQIKIAPGCTQDEVVDLCKAHHIVVEAYSPLGSGALFENETVLEMAKRYNRTPAQLALRWVLDQGFVPLPRSKTPKNIETNFDLEGFEISSEDSAILAKVEGVAEAGNPDERNF